MSRLASNLESFCLSLSNAEITGMGPCTQPLVVLFKAQKFVLIEIEFIYFVVGLYESPQLLLWLLIWSFVPSILPLPCTFTFFCSLEHCHQHTKVLASFLPLSLLTLCILLPTGSTHFFAPNSDLCVFMCVHFFPFCLKFLALEQALTPVQPPD